VAQNGTGWLNLGESSGKPPVRSTTTENHIQRIQNRLDSVYRGAIFYRPRLTELATEANNVFSADPAWPSLPEWAKDRLIQHRHHLRKMIIDQHTIQLYILRDGRRVASRYSWDAMDEESRNFVRGGGSLHIKTYWMESKETCAPDGTITIVKTPTDKVYWEPAE
jgi:hypothetical protein